MIRLETSARTGIDNIQVFEVSAFERNWAADISKKFRNVIQRTEMSPLYNCHGMTFASRRTRITKPEGIEQILRDDKWTQIEMNQVLPGDVVIYYSDENDPNHSGIIVSVTSLKVPLVCSKWGSAGEYIHVLTDHPPLYGPVTRFYRCRL